MANKRTVFSKRIVSEREKALNEYKSRTHIPLTERIDNASTDTNGLIFSRIIFQPMFILNLEIFVGQIDGEKAKLEFVHTSQDENNIVKHPIVVKSGWNKFDFGMPLGKGKIELFAKEGAQLSGVSLQYKYPRVFVVTDGDIELKKESKQRA